jgi:hypothetical protein
VTAVSRQNPPGNNRRIINHLQTAIPDQNLSSLLFVFAIAFLDSARYQRVLPGFIPLFPQDLPKIVLKA